jgi:hypothetical protein
MPPGSIIWRKIHRHGKFRLPLNLSVALDDVGNVQGPRGSTEVLGLERARELVKRCEEFFRNLLRPFRFRLGS